VLDSTSYISWVQSRNPSVTGSTCVGCPTGTTPFECTDQCSVNSVPAQTAPNAGTSFGGRVTTQYYFATEVLHIKNKYLRNPPQLPRPQSTTFKSDSWAKWLFWRLFSQTLVHLDSLLARHTKITLTTRPNKSELVPKKPLRIRLLISWANWANRTRVSYQTQPSLWSWSPDSMLPHSEHLKVTSRTQTSRVTLTITKVLLPGN